MKKKYSTSSTGARGDLDLIEIFEWHQFYTMAHSLVRTNPSFIRAFGEVAIQGTYLDRESARATLARLAPAPQPSERAEAEELYRGAVEEFHADLRHRVRLAKLLVETVSGMVEREGA